MQYARNRDVPHNRIPRGKSITPMKDKPIFLMWCGLLLGCCSVQTFAQDLVRKSEFIYQTASFPSAHASTIVETNGQLVSAWFGGTAEGNPDVAIWVARQEQDGWSPPTEVANGIQPDGNRYPCWNPVLFQPRDGPLLLFYKVGPNPKEWWGVVRMSDDGGRTWSEAANLPDDILGPIRAKPYQLKNGIVLAGSSTEHDGWVAHMERFNPGHPNNWSLRQLASSEQWQRSVRLNDSEEFGAIQPTILDHGNGQFQALFRSRQGVITESWSDDSALTWSRMIRTSLPNPSAGIDALSLKNGQHLLIYNPTTRGREKLAVGLSSDGKDWALVHVLENGDGEYSYPSAIQTTDGLVHITYTWKRTRIKHVVLDPESLTP